MTLKRFTIFSSIIIFIIIVTTIVLGCVKIDTGLKIDEPAKINVYAKTTSSLTLSNDTRPSQFNKIKTLYKNMTNLSIFNHMVNGGKISYQPNQDINKKYIAWNDSNKTNYYCIELIFDDKQSIIVSVDGDTKVIEFYSLIFKLEKSSMGKETAIYFAKNQGSSTYSESPILVTAKQNKLLKYAMEITK